MKRTGKVNKKENITNCINIYLLSFLLSYVICPNHPRSRPQNLLKLFKIANPKPACTGFQGKNKRVLANVFPLFLLPPDWPCFFPHMCGNLRTMSNKLSFQWQSSPDQMASPYLKNNKTFFFFLIYLFIFGYVGSLLLRGLSLIAMSGGYSLLWCMGFSLWWLLLLQSTGSRRTGFSSSGTRAQ